MGEQVLPAHSAQNQFRETVDPPGLDRSAVRRGGQAGATAFAVHRLPTCF
jgi:hypothetical protein